MKKNFLILGGYGNSGLLLAKLILKESDSTVILAGRSSDKAKAAAEELNRQYPEARVIARRVDITDPSSLNEAFNEVDMVILAAGSTKDTVNVAKAAIAAGVDYYDIQLSTSTKINALKAMEKEIQQAGLCFITDGGFHPGLPALLVRYIAPYFDRLESANVGSVILEDFKEYPITQSNAQGFLEDLKDWRMDAFVGGQWKKGYYQKKFDFGPVFGKRNTTHMYMEEMRLVPELIPSLEETGFYVGGFNWLMDYIVLPLAFISLKVRPEKTVPQVARLAAWAMNSMSKPPYITILKLEANGWKNYKPVKAELAISHLDGYAFTVIPVMACLLQYLNSDIRKPGLFYQAHLPEPRQMLLDMEKMGVKIELAGTASLELSTITDTILK
ncbi:MAG: saccharopine dehydrogenase NADP-binding domain-containing protein [Chloroflexi bacterium]|uniref:Saccharopine dehydrogenase NADP-binding domain-containing protein n=1 Tax=Candidatus Chlorohelix allophototropha TaxID=3003348 RepID=A0A8T7LUY9_9CHLR|nr:saccharopine dehydrogenase NADP-binding domain-containing protein [Chloroflexota bacterium]WJW67699.1 saccharopine dehydrogenase NADP-binding domain-containing protein [Chloroflexota bacterium L227-S17]